MKSENQSNSAMPFADAPPSYDNTAMVVSRPSQLPNSAGRVIILPEEGSTQLGRAHDKYSCGNPFIEIAERLARILLFIILMAYAGLAIATASNRDSLPDYPEETTDNYDETEDEQAAVAFERFFIIFVLVCSLCCTFGAMICDLPCLIGHFVTNKVMNNQAFRALDLTRWIILGFGYGIVLIMLLLLPLTRYPLTTALFSFLGIIIIMGMIMVIWDCGHLISSGAKPSKIIQPNTVQFIVPQQTV